MCSCNLHSQQTNLVILSVQDQGCLPGLVIFLDNGNPQVVLTALEVRGRSRTSWESNDLCMTAYANLILQPSVTPTTLGAGQSILISGSYISGGKVVTLESLIWSDLNFQWPQSCVCGGGDAIPNIVGAITIRLGNYGLGARTRALTSVNYNSELS